jgi:hypothetical protein
MLLCAQATAAEPVKSGPQAGAEVPSFRVDNVTGRYAGQEKCLVCFFGDDPVVMIFARENSELVTKLLRQVDEAVGKEKELGSFVVFLKQEEALDLELKLYARREKIKNVVLASFDPAGPKECEIHKDADVTVVLYVNRKVEVNHAFRKGELKDGDVARVLKDLTRILPQKKSEKP